MYFEQFVFKVEYLFIFGFRFYYFSDRHSYEPKKQIMSNLYTTDALHLKYLTIKKQSYITHLFQ